jgi:bacterioferritin-associated ferredoxin
MNTKVLIVCMVLFACLVPIEMGIFKKIKKAANKAVKTVEKAADTVADTVTDTANTVKNSVTKVVSKTEDFATDSYSVASAKVTSFLKTQVISEALLKSQFEDLASDMKDLFKSCTQGNTCSVCVPLSISSLSISTKACMSISISSYSASKPTDFKMTFKLTVGSTTVVNQEFSLDETEVCMPIPYTADLVSLCFVLSDITVTAKTSGVSNLGGCLEVGVNVDWGINSVGYFYELDCFTI